MHYDKQKRRFVFDNGVKAPPSALIFYDLPNFLSVGEEPCPELAEFAALLPNWRPHDIMSAPLNVPNAMPHQIEAIDWLVHSGGTGIVAYGMGLGKTYIAIAACGVLQRKRVLVICPAHLKLNWRKEIGMWMPMAMVHVCEGRDSDTDPNATFTIINRDILADNLTKLTNFDQVVIDESHKMGAWGTGTYKAADELCGSVRNTNGGIMLLTGTLFKNSPMDAHSALHLLNPHLAGGRVVFEERFDPLGAMKKEVIRLSRKRNTPRWLVGKKWGEIKKMEKEKGRVGDVKALRWLLSHCAISKKYAQVFGDDGKTRETKFVSVDLELSDYQLRLLNNALITDGDDVKGELSTILRIVAKQKAPHVADYADAWLQENEGKLVIATWHIEAREIVMAALEAHGVVEITGTPKQKQKAEDAFANDPDMRVCILNLESGGTGLNLVSASTMFFSEVPWTSASFEQVKARVDRIGQDASNIRYVVFIAANTPEGAKFGTVRKKSGLNDRYLGETK